MKKLKQKKPVCGCGSEELLALYYRLYGSATDVLTGNFVHVHKWFCPRCDYEIDVTKTDEDIWREKFVDQNSKEEPK